MIVPSMPFKDIFEAISEDSEKVKYRIEKVCPKAVKELKKSKSFPAWYIDEYTPGSNNKYVNFYIVRHPDQIETPNVITFLVLFDKNNHRFVIRNMMMGYRHTPESDVVALPTIHIITSHFLKQYNTRFLHNMSLTANEIAGLFLERNNLLVPLKMNEGINRNYKQYDHNEQGIRVRDGFCFTRSCLEGKDTFEAIGIIYATYMNETEMENSQTDAINKESEEVLRKFFESISDN